MKELKDKEVIIGLVVIIVLGAIALVLLVKREIGSTKKEAYDVLQEEQESLPKQPEEDFYAEAVEENHNETEKVQEASKVETSKIEASGLEASKESGKKESAGVIGLYDILGSKTYQAATLTERKQEDDQLKELYGYWDAYKLDAVNDIIRLERLQKISKELEGKNQFYYYGAVDRLGRPSGKGLAVYEGNTYYFGEWKEGLRHGKGMWLEVAIYTEENKQYDLGVVEHSYNGQWSRDLPNGEGQEHFSYAYDKLKEEFVKGNQCIANVIGGFKDGYYDGEMYVMTVDTSGNSTDWSGVCKKGVWEPIEEGAMSVSIWKTYEEEHDGSTRYQKIFPNENKEYGIIGLKKG